MNQQTPASDAGRAEAAGRSGDAPAAEAEHRFQALVEGLDAIVWEMDVSTWVFTYVSPQAERILGYPVDAWYGDPAFWTDRLVHPDDRAWAVPFCVSATREGRDHEFDYRAVAADGAVVWLRDVVRVIPDDDGTPRLLRGVMVDVTRQKEAEHGERERARHTALSGEVGDAIADGGPLREILQRCAQAMVEHLDAAFARIWTLNEAQQVLELQASAGMYTHLDGAHGRVPVGDFKIGRIAEQRAPHLTNDVPHDPWIGDPDWARREGMEAFAGYPLIADGRLVGVAALFARHALAESTLDALRGVSDRLALIVERKTTESALTEREAQLAEAQRIAHLGSWEQDVATGDVRWSDELYRIYGLLPRSVECSFESYLERVHEDDRERVRQIIDEVHRTGRTFEFEERIVRPDGEVRMLLSRGRAVADADGRVVRLVGTCQDVTEQRAAIEQEIQLAQERLARQESEAARRRVTEILESITDAFFALDRDWRFTWLNSQAERLLQRSRGELVGRGIWEEFPEAVGSLFQEQYESAMREQRTAQFEAFYPPLDAWFEVRAYPSEGGGLSIYFRDINERKEAATALLYGEQRYRSLVEAATSIVWNTPASGEFEPPQPSWSAFTGQSTEALRGWGWTDALHPDDRAATAEAWRRALASTSVYEIEHRLRRHDGVYRTMTARAVPIVEEDGTIREWIGTHTDNTERRRVEEALQESERRFRFLAESIPVHVWTARADGSLDYVNRQCVDYFGISEERLIGEGWKGVIAPEQLEEVAARWVHSISTGEPYEVQFRLRRADGAYRWHLSRAVPLRDAEGQIVRWFGSNTDIQDQKEAEAERERLIRALDLERERLQEVFALAPAAIAVSRGPEHRYVSANPVFDQLVAHRQVIGRTVRESFPELEGQGFFELLDQVYATGEPFVASEMLARLDRTGDGESEDGYFNFVYQPLFDVDGGIDGILTFAVEVTDQVLSRQLEQEKAAELERLARRLEISNRELDQFAYVASHDLKAPLRGIANLSQWIEEDLEAAPNPAVREHLDLLRGRVHRMEGLIDGILQYSRAGRVREKPEPVDVEALIHDVADLLSLPEGFTVKVGEGMPRLTTERLPLQQVFLNLIGNAAKHAGRADGVVEIGVREAGDFLHFSVIDNGPGIDEEYHERIFGIFQTLQARDKVEGTGIGLSLVQKIVENRGGRVWVESEPGAGAAFHFLWPAERK